MAGLGRRIFAAGEVLTAGNVMGYLQDQAVMNFAGTAARGSAIGTAVSEGMVSYLQDTNTLQFYDGSAWQTFADDGGLPVANGGTGATTLATAQNNLGIGLVPIAPTSVDKSGGTATTSALGEVTFSGVTSLSLNGIFSSAYSCYQFNYIQTSASVVDANIWGRLRVSSTDAATSYYEGGTLQVAAALSAINNLNINQWDLGRTHSATQPNAHASMSFKVFQPFEARPTTFYTESISWNNNNTVSFRFSGFHTGLTSYTGFSLISSSGTFGGTLSVYGFNQ